MSLRYVTLVRMVRPWPPITTVARCRPKFWWMTAGGRSSVDGRASTTCSRSKSPARSRAASDLLMSGHLIAFEGLDQSGKQTQAEQLRDQLTARGQTVRLVSFPDYSTHIGGEIAKALAG